MLKHAFSRENGHENRLVQTDIIVADSRVRDAIFMNLKDGTYSKEEVLTLLQLDRQNRTLAEAMRD